MFEKISQKFVKSPFKFCLISQILVHSLWHVCITASLVRLSLLTMTNPNQLCDGLLCVCSYLHHNGREMLSKCSKTGIKTNVL